MLASLLEMIHWLRKAYFSKIIADILIERKSIQDISPKIGNRFGKKLSESYLVAFSLNDNFSLN